jgi:hypothetical protein
MNAKPNRHRMMHVIVTTFFFNLETLNSGMTKQSSKRLHFTNQKKATSYRNK